MTPDLDKAREAAHWFVDVYGKRDPSFFDRPTRDGLLVARALLALSSAPDAREKALEEAAKVAEERTAARGQRNAKDLWRQNIGGEIAAAIRSLFPLLREMKHHDHHD